MAASRRRRSARAGRPPIYSPGRPPVAQREHRQWFWRAIADGASSEEAGRIAAVSPAVGCRWFREGGGMPTIKLTALSRRYLSFSEREEIAISHAQKLGVRAIARRLGRSPSTISWELRRNAATRSGGFEYRATTAQWHADRCARRPKVAKLAKNEALRTWVEERLAGHVCTADGRPIAGPRAATWNGRRHGRRADRRWAKAWSPADCAPATD